MDTQDHRGREGLKITCKRGLEREIYEQPDFRYSWRNIEETAEDRTGRRDVFVVHPVGDIAGSDKT